MVSITMYLDISTMLTSQDTSIICHHGWTKPKTLKNQYLIAYLAWLHYKDFVEIVEHNKIKVPQDECLNNH